MNHIFAITDNLATGPRPNAQELEQWCENMFRFGIHHVVSLISKEEINAYGLQKEEEALALHKIGFDGFPIHDFDVPDELPFQNMMAKLVKMHEAGKNIFLHCAGGVGRAGTLACCLLVHQGFDTDDAVALVSEKRGRISPETKRQVQFVRDYQISCSHI